MTCILRQWMARLGLQFPASEATPGRRISYASTGIPTVLTGNLTARRTRAVTGYRSPTQSFILRPLTRVNSFTLCVTSVAPRVLACAAISKSLGPIRLLKPDENKQWHVLPDTGHCEAWSSGYAVDLLLRRLGEL